MVRMVVGAAVIVSLVLVPLTAQDALEPDRLAAMELQIRAISSRLDQLVAAMSKQQSHAIDDQKRSRVAAMAAALDEMRSQCPNGAQPIVMQQAPSAAAPTPALLFGCVSR